ncbi:MAG: hypothetical protein VKK04_26870 [Synechococcales bacterium]|nr:hypothetical protein [Synechococcales bacterium]
MKSIAIAPPILGDFANLLRFVSVLLDFSLEKDDSPPALDYDGSGNCRVKVG